MARKTQKETQETIHQILLIAEEQLLRLGYEKMSYTTLSQQCGISRTGICHHFPTKVSIPLALRSQLLEQILRPLRFDLALEDFTDSWLEALNDKQFRAVWRVIFHLVVAERHQGHFARQFITHLTHVCENRFNQPAEATIQWLIGRTLLTMNK